ncbi:MAG: DnaJ domain-containing protein [Phycisphaerales bacterium]
MNPDPFQALGLAARFDLDPVAIRAAYLARAAAAHPDIVGGDDEAARAMAALNDAKATLEDHERRAEALLLRLGGPTKEADRSLPEGFLAETLELRERIDDDLASARGEEARATWARWAEAERREMVSRVAALFARAGSTPAPDALRAVRTRLNAWRYLERLIEQLDPARPMR